MRTWGSFLILCGAPPWGVRSSRNALNVTISPPLPEAAHPANAVRLSRSRISLPVLKNGTDFLSTETCAPVRGFLPVRAGRVLDRKSAEPAQLNAVTSGHRCNDFAQNGVDNFLNVTLIEMRVLQ